MNKNYGDVVLKSRILELRKQQNESMRYLIEKLYGPAFRAFIASNKITSIKWNKSDIPIIDPHKLQDN